MIGRRNGRAPISGQAPLETRRLPFLESVFHQVFRDCAPICAGQANVGRSPFATAHDRSGLIRAYR
jgi:hypothetical protein